MNGYLEVIRMLVLHPELASERLRTTLMLRTADFVESQPFTIKIVIIYYYFKGESWTAATSKIGAKKNIDYVTVVKAACLDWDKTHMYVRKGDNEW